MTYQRDVLTRPTLIFKALVKIAVDDNLVFVLLSFKGLMFNVNPLRVLLLSFKENKI